MPLFHDLIKHHSYHAATAKKSRLQSRPLSEFLLIRHEILVPVRCVIHPHPQTPHAADEMPQSNSCLLDGSPLFYHQSMHLLVPIRWSEFVRTPRHADNKPPQIPSYRQPHHHPMPVML